MFDGGGDVREVEEEEAGMVGVGVGCWFLGWQGQLVWKWPGWQQWWVWLPVSKHRNVVIQCTYCYFVCMYTCSYMDLLAFCKMALV